MYQRWKSRSALSACLVHTPAASSGYRGRLHFVLCPSCGARRKTCSRWIGAPACRSRTLSGASLASPESRSSGEVHKSLRRSRRAGCCRRFHSALTLTSLLPDTLRCVDMAALRQRSSSTANTFLKCINLGRHKEIKTQGPSDAILLGGLQGVAPLGWSRKVFFV